MSSSNSPGEPGGGETAVDVDRALLAALARDGRASYTDLAERVGLSVSAVHQRVRRLEQRGLIKGYRATLDAKALGLPLTAFVSITPIDGFAGSVPLKLGGLPSNASGSFSPKRATSASTLTVNTEAEIQAGTYTLTITATSGSLIRTASVTLIVQ